MSYKNFAIGDGQSANVVFAELARRKYSDFEAKILCKELLKYCGKDTLAMEKIHNKLIYLAIKLFIFTPCFLSYQPPFIIRSQLEKECNMKVLDPLDHEAIEEVATKKSEIHRKIDLANEKLNSNQPNEAKLLFEEARDLAFHAGKGLKVRIMNEDADREMWNELNKKIESLSHAT
jgi:hypothetical protein